MLARLGEHLRQARKQHGWSQEEPAYECGLHRTYIGAIERGEYNVTLLSLRKITDTLRTSLPEAVTAAVGTRRRKK